MRDFTQAHRGEPPCGHGSRSSNGDEVSSTCNGCERVIYDVSKMVYDDNKTAVITTEE